MGRCKERLHAALAASHAHLVHAAAAVSCTQMHIPATVEAGKPRIENTRMSTVQRRSRMRVSVLLSWSVTCFAMGGSHHSSLFKAQVAKHALHALYSASSHQNHGMAAAYRGVLAISFLLLLLASSGHASRAVKSWPQLQLGGSFLDTVRHWMEGMMEKPQSTAAQEPSSSRIARPHKDFVDDDGVRVHWALVCAGSNSWWNYRHQADVAHAYQVLRHGGLIPERIVVMMYDDLVMDTNNPQPGKLFNRPGGPDVYKGIHIDYKGLDVTSATFLAVLEGNATAVEGVGSGKVIASGPKDRVFVFYSDHGSPGVLGMPTGPFLYADQLISVLERKHEAGGYREMTLYIEACESGSMFEGLLKSSLPVYATTAANAQESSWGTYCPGLDLPLTQGFDTCLGDLYRDGHSYVCVAWMEDAECEDGELETLGAQFELVKARTSNNFTYNMGSHAMQYGRTGMRKEHTGDYLGYRDTSACMLPPVSQLLAPLTMSSTRVITPAKRTQRHRHHHAVPQREADLVPLRVAVARARTPEQRIAAQSALEAEVNRRATVDRGVGRAVAYLLTAPQVSPQLLHHMGVTRAEVFATKQSSIGDNRLAPATEYVTRLIHTPLISRPAGKPLVDSWDCLRDMVAAYTQVCGRMDQYTMKHTRLMANLCNAHVSPTELARALSATNACAAMPAATKTAVA